MTLRQKNIYNLLLTGCFAGYIWLYWSISSTSLPAHAGTGICILKQVTAIPCPSCGSTRSVISILNGDFIQALKWNPLGFFLLLFLIALPIWIIYDRLSGNNSLFRFYTQVEMRLKQKKIAVPAVMLILLNWYWNIYKGL